VKIDQDIEVDFDMIEIGGKEYPFIVHVEKQSTQIKVTRAGVEDSDALRNLDMEGPILLVKAAQLAGMTKPAAVLLMHPSDFDKIKEAVHAGAFGSDYAPVVTDKGNQVALWKLAADLNGIAGYEAVPVPVDVGTYPLCDDWGTSGKLTVTKGLIGEATTKLRYDRSNGGQVTSVHHLELANNTQLASISTDKFFEDFYRITKNDDEQQRVKQMFKELEEDCGIIAVLSNSTQHQIAFLEHKGQELEASKFADLLNEDVKLGNIIRSGLATRGYGGAIFDEEGNNNRFNVWKDDYIATYMIKG